MRTQRAALARRVDAIADWFLSGDIFDEGSCRLADSMLRVQPDMFTSFCHQGMPNNSNGVERTIRHHHVRTRRMQCILPDWTAKNAGSLRSIYATCDIHGRIPGDILDGRRDASQPRRAYRHRYSTVGARPFTNRRPERTPSTLMERSIGGSDRGDVNAY